MQLVLATICLSLAACEEQSPIVDTTTTGASAHLSMADMLGKIEEVGEVTGLDSPNLLLRSGQPSNLFLGARISGDGHMIVYVPPVKKATDKYQVWARDLTDSSRAPFIVSSMDGTLATANDDHMGHPNVDFKGQVAVFAGFASNLGGSAKNRTIYAKSLTDLTQAPKVISKFNGVIADCHTLSLSPSGERLLALCSGANWPDQPRVPVYMLYSFDLTASTPTPVHISVAGFDEISGWQLKPSNFSSNDQKVLLEAFNFGADSKTTQVHSKTLIYDFTTSSATEVNRGYAADFICVSSTLSSEGSYVLTACRAPTDNFTTIVKVDLTTLEVTQPFYDLTARHNAIAVGNRFFTDETQGWTAGFVKRDGVPNALYLNYKTPGFDSEGNKIEKNNYFYLNSASGTDLGNTNEVCDWLEPSADMSRFVYSCVDQNQKRVLYKRGAFAGNL